MTVSRVNPITTMMRMLCNMTNVHDVFGVDMLRSGTKPYDASYLNTVLAVLRFLLVVFVI